MMKVEETTKDIFSIEELYLLADATEQQLLFGLPEREIFALLNRNFLEVAKQAVQEKGILDEAGHLSKGGYFVVKAIQEYAESKKYIQINNLFIGFSQSEPDNLIVISEVEAQKSYRISVVDKLLVLKGLLEMLPIVAREPLEDETTFILKKVRNRERREFEEKEVGENSIYLETFEVKEHAANEFGKEGWLCYLDEDKLYTVHLEDGKYYRASQYWLMKQLFDSLEIPYGEGDVNGKED